MRTAVVLCLVLAGCVADPPIDPPIPRPILGTGTLMPPSTVPSAPIPYTADTVFTVDSGTTNYVVVPAGYDPSHRTPAKLLVWLHGCGGYASGDIYMLSPELSGAAQDWISMAVGGREGDCWDPDRDMPKVSAALATLETHFNIDPRTVVLGGYSSGGDLGYRMAFDHANLFAGLVAENTSPFRDTGATQAQSLAAASWKINIRHLAHLEDETYPISGVRSETDAVANAGFPIERIERPGGHYDDENQAVYPGSTHPVPGTTDDFITYLLPAMDAGWLAP